MCFPFANRLQTYVIIPLIILAAGAVLFPVTILQSSASNCKPLWKHSLRGGNSIAISNDGKFVVASSEGSGLGNDNILTSFEGNSSIPIWQTNSSGNAWDFPQLTMSADGTRFSLEGPAYSEWVGLWKNPGAGLQWTFPDHLLRTSLTGLPTPATDVAVSGDGQYVAVRTFEPSYSDTLYLLRTGSNVPLWSYNLGNPNEYKFDEALGISYEGAYVATIKDESLLLFGQHDNQTLWVAKTPAYRIVMSSTADQILAADNTTISEYSKNDNSTLATFRFGLLIDFDVSSDGTTLAVTSGDRYNHPTSISAWNLNTHEQVFNNPSRDAFVHVSGNGERIVESYFGFTVLDATGKQICTSDVSR